MFADPAVKLVNGPALMTDLAEFPEPFAYTLQDGAPLVYRRDN